jgi:hypothetical protein
VKNFVFSSPTYQFVYSETKFTEKPTGKIRAWCIICGSSFNSFKLGETANLYKHLSTHPVFQQWKEKYNAEKGESSNGKKVNF